MSTRTRQTAGERRETVLRAAIKEFAALGYHGTPTEQIARSAGISHAYLFRLYGTKKELFLACLERCFDRMHETFREAAANKDDDEPAIAAMGRAYVELLGDRDLLLLQLQIYAAAEDPDIRAAARVRYAESREVVKELAGVDDVGALKFVSQGMLLNSTAALELDPDAWVWLSEEEFWK